MKTITLVLDYKIKDITEDKKRNITVSYLEGGVNLVNAKGLDGEKRRIFGRTQRKLDEALENKKNEVELEDAEFDLLNDCFKKATFDALLSKHLLVLEEEMIKVYQNNEK